MSIVRKSLGALSAAAMLLSATAASAASVRPSESLVSASAAPVSAIEGVRRDAGLAQANAATTTTWVLTFIVVGTIIIAIWIAVDSDDEPESP